MLICFVTFVTTFLLLKAKDTEATLLKPGRKCVPTAMVRGPCHICVCSIDGVFHCRAHECKGVNSANVTKRLPEIRPGMNCVYGKTYRMDCNTCRCGHNNALLCTKIACLSVLNSEIIPSDLPKKVDDVQENTIKKKKKRIVRRGSRRGTHEDTGVYPPMPRGKSCVAGRYYQEECKRCLCRANRQPICSLINTCQQNKRTKISKPEDVRPPVGDKEFKYLPALPTTASPCVPGTTYKVDCNVCVCNERQNLLCDKLLCISFDDMHRAEAMKKSGLPCNTDNYQENEVMQSKCVQCICNKTTYCEPVEGCVSETEVHMRTYGSRRNGSRLTFDYNKEKCVPDHIYTDNCNKCYCQKDQTLRCTQKTCLNYNQALVLEKEHQYLQEHGL